MNTFKIESVNGIAALNITLDGPGVYVARGPNGAGKSSAILALRAANGDATALAEPSDGEDKGTVSSGDGVVFRVGHRRKIDGRPSVRILSTASLGRLIDPGLQDSGLAAKARLKALLALMPLPADEAARVELTGNDEELRAWIKGDPSSDALDLAEALRKRANELANDLEKRAAECAGESASLQGLIEALGKLDFEAGDYRSARALADQLLRDAEVKTHTAKARADLEKQQEEIRETLGPKPDTTNIQAEFDRLNLVALELEERAAAARGQWMACGEKLKAARIAAAQWDRGAEILQRPVEGPTFAEAQTATQLADLAQVKAERARTVETAKDYLAKATAAHEAAQKHAERAKALREIAKGTAPALGRLLERRGLPGLVIHEGRLCVRSGATLKDFDTRLSFGERVRAALGIALAGLSAPAPGEKRLPILPLEPTFWLALDEGHKAEVATIAQERGVCLVTEEPDGGELRFERRN